MKDLSFRDILRELLAAIITLVLLGVAVYLWTQMTSPTVDDAAFARFKEVLQSVSPLLGTAIGYYLGRISAERSADQAQKSAQKTLQNAAEANAAAQRAIDEAESALARNDPGAMDGARQSLTQARHTLRA
jgi:uncharacterized membrane protein